LTDRHFESVVFNVGDLGDLGGDFSFQVGDFCSLNILKFWIDSKKTVFVTLESKQLMHFRLQGSWHKSIPSGHVPINPPSFCVTLHCTNYPRALRLSLIGSQAVRFSQRLWMCKYVVETNVQIKIKV